MRCKPAAAALALALVLGTAPILVPHDALAQGTAAPAPAAPAPSAPARHEHPDHTEGRIAFLRAELKITDAQTQQWNAVADVMRRNAAERRDAMQRLGGAHGTPVSAVERLQERQQFAQMRADDVKQFAAAFTPLYNSMSPEQKQAADQFFAHGPGGGRHHGHHWR